MKEWVLYDKNWVRYTLELDRCYWTLNGERLYTMDQLAEMVYDEDEAYIGRSKEVSE